MVFLPYQGNIRQLSSSLRSGNISGMPERRTPERDSISSGEAFWKLRQHMCKIDAGATTSIFSCIHFVDKRTFTTFSTYEGKADRSIILGLNIFRIKRTCTEGIRSWR